MGQRYGELLIYLFKYVECYEIDKICLRLQKEIDQEVQNRDVCFNFFYREIGRVVVFVFKYMILIYRILEVINYCYFLV